MVDRIDKQANYLVFITDGLSLVAKKTNASTRKIIKLEKKILYITEHASQTEMKE